MASKGSSKELSVRHEDYIAQLFNGKRSKSSGAADHDYSDVKNDIYAIECKMTMSGSKPKIVTQMEKVTQEAYEHGREPILALRYYLPDSLLANQEGWVDLTVHLAKEDAERASI